MICLKVLIRSFLLSIFFIILLSLKVLSQDAFYYGKTFTETFYYSTEKIVLKLVADTSISLQGITGLDPAFDTSRTPEPTMLGFYFVYLLPGSDVNQTLNSLSSNASVEIVNPVYISTISGENIAFDRVIVKFLDSVSRATIDSMNNANRVSIVDSVIGIPNYYILKITKQTGNNVMEVANIYEQSSLTVFAAPDYLVEIGLDSAPPDQFWYYQWNFNNTGQTGGNSDADIDADSAWSFGFGDSTMIVADIDAGVESHEDLPSARLYDGYDYAGTY